MHLGMVTVFASDKNGIVTVVISVDAKSGDNSEEKN